MEVEQGAGTTANKRMPRQRIPISTKPNDGTGPSSTTKPRSPVEGNPAAPNTTGRIEAQLQPK